MNLLQAIEKEDSYATLQDRASELLHIMDNLGFQSLPVVNEGYFLGLISTEALREIEDLNRNLGELDLPYQQLFLREDQHIIEALAYFSTQVCNVLPVVTQRQVYLGIITLQGLINALSEILDSARPGGFVVLEVGLRDNALSHIAHIVESADAQVLSSFTRQIPNSTRMLITLKLNVSNVSPVVGALQRHDYRVLSTYSQEPMDDELQARYENLMNYIKM